MPLRPGTQPVRTPHGQLYGAAKRQEEAQAAQPIAGAPSRPPSSSGGQRRADAASSPHPLPPGSLPGMSAPTARPTEPITAGLPMGAGAGPEALTTASFGPEELSVLRGIYLQYPNEELRRLIEWTESNLA